VVIQVFPTIGMRTSTTGPAALSFASPVAGSRRYSCLVKSIRNTACASWLLKEVGIEGRVLNPPGGTGESSQQDSPPPSAPAASTENVNDLAGSNPPFGHAHAINRGASAAAKRGWALARG
jgi:hypothetical protein